ncbi:MAG: LicD family protein [Firmicutes bacterium]|nr:LicD family protein [Bacillota bacterium]MDY5856756.1 LicD family protein [Anaerovoracaceae bacterium]
MTPLQETEFTLLKKAIEICDELEIKYYLACGSALGAIKYKGFIPWDDDVDICMTRKDYEIFCERAPALLPDYYFLQNVNSEKNTPFIFSKLRDSRTTFVEKSISHMNINHGVYIDIFPLDGYPREVKAQNAFERNLRILKLQLNSAYRFEKNVKLLTKLFFRLEKVLGFHRRTYQIIKKINCLITKYSIGDSELWCNHGNWQGKLDYAPQWHYGDGAWATFEGMKVRVPENYDAYLTQKYGNWREDLPESQKYGHHYCEIIDLNHPYTSYIDSISTDGRNIKLISKLEE